ncbi:MAG: MFS transporter [Pseudomonadales bacterium]
MTREVQSIAGTPAASPLGYFSWTSGQLGRDPYYILVVIYIFFPYFSTQVVGDPVYGQALIGYLNAVSGALLALTIPFLGAIADKQGRRKPWIAGTVGFMSLGACMLWWIMPGAEGSDLYWAFFLLLSINLAFAYSEVFHNAMLPSITPVDRAGLVSGLAFSLGNLGGVSLMVFVLFAFALPGVETWSFLPDQPLWGVDQLAHEQDRIVGPISGLWMLIFTLPLLFFTPDTPRSGLTLVAAARSGLKDVFKTVSQLKHYANIARYLLARMLFNDGMVGVLIFGGVYAAGNFDWDTISLLIFGLCTSVSAMLGAYLGGRLDDRFGSLATLKVSVLMTFFILLALVSIETDRVAFIVAVDVAPVWSFPYFNTQAEIIYFCVNQVFALFFVTALSASRTLMAKICPPEKAAQFFGLYGLSGSVTAFLAPLLVATTTQWFDSQRVGFGSLAFLIVLGAGMLYWVSDERTEAPREA